MKSVSAVCLLVLLGLVSAQDLPNPFTESNYHVITFEKLLPNLPLVSAARAAEVRTAIANFQVAKNAIDNIYSSLFLFIGAVIEDLTNTEAAKSCAASNEAKHNDIIADVNMPLFFATSKTYADAVAAVNKGREQTPEDIRKQVNAATMGCRRGKFGSAARCESATTEFVATLASLTDAGNDVAVQAGLDFEDLADSEVKNGQKLLEAC